MHLSDFQIGWIAWFGFIFLVAGLVFGKLIYEDLKLTAGWLKSELASRRWEKRNIRELEEHFKLTVQEKARI